MMLRNDQGQTRKASSDARHRTPTPECEDMRRSLFSEAFSRLVKEKPLGTFGAVISLVLLLTGIFADFLAPYGMNEIHTDHMLEAPSTQFWLGTDNLGRDLLSRVIFGARVSVIVGLSATSLATVVSVTIGLVSGYFGGVLDLTIQRLVDAVMCLPWLILLMVVMSLVGGGMLQIIVVVGVVWGIGGSRTIRGIVLSTRESVYVSASVAIGCRTFRTLARHILPNIVAPIIVGFTTTVPGVILTEASLSFLGFGVPPPVPSWGGMLSSAGRRYMFLAPWMVLWPGLALCIVVYGVNMFGDALRDILDPKLRGGGGQFRQSASARARRLVQESKGWTDESDRLETTRTGPGRTDTG